MKHLVRCLAVSLGAWLGCLSWRRFGGRGGDPARGQFFPLHGGAAEDVLPQVRVTAAELVEQRVDLRVAAGEAAQEEREAGRDAAAHENTFTAWAASIVVADEPAKKKA